MDSYVDHAKNTTQFSSGRACNYFPTKSCENINKSKSSDQQSTFNSHSTHTVDTTHHESATWFAIDSRKEVFRTLPIEQDHFQKLRNLQKRHTLPAKAVFLKWWLDTLGHSTPLRSAWEDDEESIFRLTTSSRTCSPTYFSGQGVNFRHSSNSGAYKFVSKRDPDVHNSSLRRPINSVAGVSRLIYPFPKSHKRQKTKTRSSRSHLNSSLSLNESVNQTVSVRQEFLDKEGKLYGQKCPELGQHRERQPEVNDAHSWLSITSSATRHMHDRNTSSNVIVLAQLSLHKASRTGLLDKKGIVKNDQEENPKKNTSLSRVQEVRGQQTSKSDIGMSDEVRRQQNIDNNLILLTDKSKDSQADDKLFSFTVNGRDIIETITSPANEPTIAAISISHHQNNMQTQIISDNCLLTCGTAVSKAPTPEGQYEKPQQSLLLHRDIEEATAAAYGDQNYNSPVIRTESNSSNNGHCSLSLAKEADKSPPKVSMDDDCCLSGNYISNRMMLSPNFYIHFGKHISAEHEKRRHLLNGHTNIMDNDLTSVHEENNCRRHSGSYFSRLVEKRIKVKESQHIDNHEKAPINHKLNLNVQANTDSQFAPMSTIFLSSNQSNEQSPLPLAVSKPELDRKYLVLHKHAVSDDPENKRIQVSSDGSKSLDQNSEMLPSDDDRSSINNNTNRLNKTVTGTDQARCSSPGIPLEHQQNDCSLSSSEDPHMNSFTGTTIRNQNNAKFESEDDNSSSDNNEQNSLSSYAHSSLPSASAGSRYSSSDVNVSISEYLKCSSASWSTTSLPPQLYLEPKVSQIKYAASSTNIEEIRRNQIIQTARLLILMLDKLPLEDHVWCNNYLHENKRKHSELSCKHGQRYQRRPIARSVSFHSYILSLFKKHYSFDNIKPTLKMDNEESVQERALATNESTQNSKLAMCLHDNLVSKHKTVKDKMKLVATSGHETPSFDDSSRKPQFQYATYGFTKYASKTNERDCIKGRRKRKKNFGHFCQMFPRGKCACLSRKVSNDTSSSSSMSKMLYQPNGSENQQVFQKVIMFSKPNVQTFDQMQEKHKRKKYQTDLNNCENITSESDFRYGPVRVSKRMSREQSRDLSDVNTLTAKPDQRENNMTAEVAFHSQSGMLVCHKPHSPEASLKKSEVQMLSPPYLDTSVPVYPKPKPCAIGGIPDQETLKPKEAFSLPNPTARQLSLASLKRSISSKLPWTKLPLQKLQASEINHNPLGIATVANTETRSHMKSNKETFGTNSYKHVLPPLLCSTSENVEINSDKCMNNSKILKSGMLLAQHKTSACKEDNSQAKQDLSSLVHLDSLPKHYCDCKPASLENSRIYSKIPLASLQNHGSALSPLRQRFYHVTSKVSNSAPKTLHSPSWGIPYAPYYLCGRGAVGNDTDKTITASPDVSIVNAEANDLQSLITEAESEEGDSCKSCEMHNINRFVNKNGIKTDRSEISSVLCKNSLAIQNTHTDKGSSSNNLPDARICKESKVNIPDHDEKSVCPSQENKSPDTTFKTQNLLEPKDNCNCTSKFKFLTLLLSDELDKSQI